MKIINRIVESEMTADEQVELTRLEDEVAQALDEVDQLFDGEDILFRCVQNLNNYVDTVTKAVMERMHTCVMENCNNPTDEVLCRKHEDQYLKDIGF